VEEAGAQEVMGNSKAKWDSAYDNDVKRRRVAAMQAKTMALAAGEAVRRGLHLNPSWGCQPEPDFQDLPSETDSDDPHSDETLSRRAAVERGAHGQERRDKRIARREVARHGSKRLSHESGGDGGMKRRRGEDSPVGQQRRRDHQRDESEPQPAWRQSPSARGVGGGEDSPVGQLHGKVTEAEAALMGRPALKTAWTLKYGRGTTSGNGDWLRRSLVGTVLPRAPRAGTAHGRLDLLTAAAALSGGGGREEEEEEEEEEVETPETGSYVSDGSSETLDD
jgi:hypothetical protein